MARVIRKEMKALDLPKEWWAGLDAAPDEIVRVTVDARRRRDVRALFRRAAGRRGDVAQPVLHEPMTDLDAWFAELDRFAAVPFMEYGRGQPPMPKTEQLF